MAENTGIDPRGPRFGAAITGILLLVVIGVWLSGHTLVAFVIFAFITLVFAWGAFAVIELAAGTLRASETVNGDVVEIVPAG